MPLAIAARAFYPARRGLHHTMPLACEYVHAITYDGLQLQMAFRIETSSDV